MMQKIQLTTNQRSALVNITSEVQDMVRQSGVEEGLCVIYSPHTTAGITIQEGFDPDVVRDIAAHLAKNVPHEGEYHHAEGNSDSHIKAMLTGNSQTLPVAYGKAQLGRWQAIFFCEFDGPRERSVWVQVVSAK